MFSMHDRSSAPTRWFRLAPHCDANGVSCDARGAFVGTVPLLTKLANTSVPVWQPRGLDDINADLAAVYGVPIDVGSKLGGSRQSLERSILATCHWRRSRRSNCTCQIHRHQRRRMMLRLRSA